MNMKEISRKPIFPIPKTILITILITIPFLLFLSYNSSSPATATAGAAVAVTGNPQDGLKIRSGYKTYDSYIQRQLNKTLNPHLREVWKTRDWDRKIRVFSAFFDDLRKADFVRNGSKVLCIGARMGQEVEALRRIGVADSIGMDLVPSPPLVVEGDFHAQPFKGSTFDLEFSNVFDHALYPDKFVAEIERTLKPGGACVLHVSIKKGTDKYSANDLYSIEPLKKLFKKSELVRVRTIDGFGLDTEVIFRRN